MIREGSAKDPILVHSCAGAQGAGLKLVSEQFMGEPLEKSRARALQVEALGERVQELAEGIDRRFCESHCDPDNCIKYVGGTLVELNQRILLRGGTNKKDEVVAIMAQSDGAQTIQSAADCPYLRGDIDPLIEDLIRAGQGDSEIFTDEAPGLGVALVDVIDPEVIADPEGRTPSGPLPEPALSGNTPKKSIPRGKRPGEGQLSFPLDVAS